LIGVGRALRESAGVALGVAKLEVVGAWFGSGLWASRPHMNRGGGEAIERAWAWLRGTIDAVRRPIIFVRKTVFIKYWQAFVVFPEDYGTMDELFEATSTIKITKFPIVPVGRGYWSGLLGWLKKSMLAEGNIAPEELELFHVADDPVEILNTARAGKSQKQPAWLRGGSGRPRIDAGRCRVGAIATSVLGRRTGATRQP
jgi:hypothetical protein